MLFEVYLFFFLKGFSKFFNGFPMVFYQEHTNPLENPKKKKSKKLKKPKKHRKNPKTTTKTTTKNNNKIPELIKAEGSMMGSVEFCCVTLGARLVVVLGHSNCKAIEGVARRAGTLGLGWVGLWSFLGFF